MGSPWLLRKRVSLLLFPALRDISAADDSSIYKTLIHISVYTIRCLVAWYVSYVAILYNIIHSKIGTQSISVSIQTPSLYLQHLALLSI